MTPTQTAIRPWLGLLLFLLFAVVVLLVAPWVGMEWVSPAAVWRCAG